MNFFDFFFFFFFAKFDKICQKKNKLVEQKRSIQFKPSLQNISENWFKLSQTETNISIFFSWRHTKIVFSVLKIPGGKRKFFHWKVDFKKKHVKKKIKKNSTFFFSSGPKTEVPYTLPSPRKKTWVHKRIIMFWNYFQFQTFFEEALKILTVFPYQWNIGTGLPMFRKYLWFQNFFFWEALKIWQSFPITEMSIFLKKDCTGLPMFLKYFEFQTFFEEALKILTVFPYQGNIGAGLPMFQKYLWFQNCFFFGKFWKFWQSFPITEMSIFLKKDCTGLPMFLKYFEFQNFFFLGSFENFDSLSL